MIRCWGCLHVRRAVAQVTIKGVSIPVCAQHRNEMMARHVDLTLRPLDRPAVHMAVTV